MVKLPSWHAGIICGLSLSISLACSAAEVPAAASQPAGSATAGSPGQPIPELPPLPDINQTAYKEVVQEAAPLSPEQIKGLRKIVDDAERAASAQPRFFPKIVTNSVQVSLSPGQTPQVVRLYSGFVTTLLIVDQVGNPLIVKDVTVGNEDKNFTVTWSKEAETVGSNYVKLSPKTTYAYGNVSINLAGINVPVSLTLVSGQREVDDRVDVRVQGVGNIVQNTLPKGVEPVVLDMLAGFGPKDSTTLKTSNPDVKAWEYNDKFYVRTNFSLLSPAYLSMQKSADGAAVYEIPRTPVLIALSNGAAVTINLSGY